MPGTSGYENALKPVLSQAELVAHDSQDINDCDSSTYGSHVYMEIEDVEPKTVLAVFEKDGWRSEPAAVRSRGTGPPSGATPTT